ncbi:NAD(P)/FAD-dependent oxidoreductase [Candidatus Saccharibacteria bacterium]|nr:NAD(P)/FAD-dependent oxidoreductase [Candidatus Saccharibacteria bacterium]
MGKRFDFEYIVIGGGVAGIAAAMKLAKAKRKVALIEQNKWGGANVNSRDVPQKALFHFSHLYAEAIAGSKFGISSNNLRYNYPSVARWRDIAIAKSTPKKKDLEAAGVVCLKGKAHFVGPNDIAVGDGQISANKFIIATGSEMAENNISGLDTTPYLTPETALTVERPPKAVLIVGGGASGCEIVNYYAELGAKVVIVEMKNKLLPREDAEVSELVEQYFDKKLGVKVFTKTRVVALEKDKHGSKVVFSRNGSERAVRVETIVLATGSKPATDLGLPNAKVSFDKTGIVVDRTLQTSARNIFAIGDVIGGDSSTERAIYTAEIATLNMLERNKTYINFDGFIRTVDTYPQIASVGMTEKEIAKKAKKYKKVLVPLSATQAATTSDFKIGFLKMIADNQGKIISATAVSPDAALVLQEVALAIRHKLPLTQVASTPHPSGSWAELVKIAAKQLLSK